MLKFRPPLYSRIMFGMFFWIAAIPLMLSVVFVFATQLFSGFRYLDMFFVCSILFTTLPLFSLGFLFPTIGVSEEYLRLYTPWGQYKSVQWGDIFEITRMLPPRGVRLIMKGLIQDRALFVKVEGLGWIFKMWGFFYSDGDAGFIIHPKIERHKELASLFKKYAPQAFSDESED